MRSTTVCLIIPPSVFLLDERVFATLGVLRVASVLEGRGIPVSVLDLSGIGNFVDVVKVHAAETPAIVYGITTTTPQLPAARLVAEAIREVSPTSRIVLGGPHVTLTHSAALREKKRNACGRAEKALGTLQEMADVLVAGDGEFSIHEALTAPRGSIVNADDPLSALFLTSADLNEQPLPARHLIDLDSYHYHIDGVRATSLIAQLGCPFACGFCGGRLSPSLRRVRTRSVEHVVAEMVSLHKTYGFCGFMLYDDELNVNPDMIRLMEEIRRAQDELGVEWRLRGFVKSQLFTDAQAEVMYQAGFRWILVGFESGAERILTNINKRATAEENTRCMEIARRHDLRVKALMSLGHPGESAETIEETRQWLLANKPDDFDATIITTYPGTPYYDDAVLIPPVRENGSIRIRRRETVFIHWRSTSVEILSTTKGTRTVVTDRMSTPTSSPQRNWCENAIDSRAMCVRRSAFLGIRVQWHATSSIRWVKAFRPASYAPRTKVRSRRPSVFSDTEGLSTF